MLSHTHTTVNDEDDEAINSRQKKNFAWYRIERLVPISALGRSPIPDLLCCIMIHLRHTNLYASTQAHTVR